MQEERSSSREEAMNEQEMKQRQESPRLKRCRLDRKVGRRLVKDTTAVKDITALVNISASTEPNTTLELIREPQPIIMAQSQLGKGVFTADSEVLKYPDIPDTAHEFGALLQFGTTFELMEFLAMQQIKVSQRMAEEHAK